MYDLLWQFWENRPSVHLNLGLFIPNCSQGHTITNTNCQKKAGTLTVLCHIYLTFRERHHHVTIDNKLPRLKYLKESAKNHNYLACSPSWFIQLNHS